MEIASFADLLLAACAQSQPQRLLFVFAGTELPDDSSVEQRVSFAAGLGGALVPLMVVDKSPGEIESFEALLEESAALGQEWKIMFAAALSGADQHLPSSAQAQAALQRMVEAVRQGMHQSFIPFDRSGHPVLFG